LSQPQLPKSLAELAPFQHDVEIAPGVFTNPHIHRIRHAVNLFFPGLLRLCGGSLRGLRVLDVGCNSGGFSFMAHKFGADEVVGIDPRASHLKQANAIRDVLDVSGVRFECASIEDLTPERFGMFDVTLLMGIMYHLQDPIGAIHKVSAVSRSLLVIDSHVHYSTDANSEDYARWWMLRDTDQGVPDGIFEGDENAAAQAWLRFEQENPVDYAKLPDQFVGSPHTRRETRFSELINPEPPASSTMPDGVCAREQGSLVMVPNRRALIDLVRDAGFEDVLEVVPHRFSEKKYLYRYRTGVFALKRSPDGPFPLSVLRRSNP
jgi:SAM-dependent methyltransferase